MKWGSKIIITGVYGAGKTTLAKDLVERLSKEGDSSYTYLDFDNIFKYKGWDPPGLAPIHTALRDTEYAILDALPRLPDTFAEDEQWHDLVDNYDCTFIVVKCPLEVWLARCDENGRTQRQEQHHVEFYDMVDERLEGVNYIIYNSQSGEFEDE